MCDTGYTVRELARDLRDLKERALAEPEMLAESAELVKRLVLMKHNWLRTYMAKPAPTPEEGPKRHVLHEEPDHSLALFVVAMNGGERTAPHDHGTWAVIAGLEGREVNRRWKREGDAVVPAGEDTIDDATIVTLPGSTIHSLHNETDCASVTLQLYGINPDQTQHRNYTPRRSP
jgi:predicted metal-dependent enzyme (double-stranded beta helix superfamily)